jgi:adenylate cyclase
MAANNGPDLKDRVSGERRLVAVAFIDMVGYSRLLAQDDIGILGRLQTLRRNLIDPAINRHGGRIVSTAGDSLFIEYTSIDGAVRSAILIQQHVPGYEFDQPPDRTIQFRIGINIGDVIADGTNLHGDGVNVAARLETACPVGGICVSRAVRDHMVGRLDLDFDELGPLSLKNIPRPVEAFVLHPQPMAARPEFTSSDPLLNQSSEQARLPRLSVMVMPLRNLGIPKGQEHLAEEISEDFITELARLPGSFVIGGADFLSLGGNATNPRDAASKRGITFLIQGSVRANAERIGVNLQLIDVRTGMHLKGDRLEVGRTETSDALGELSARLARSVTLELIKDVNRRIEALPPQQWKPGDFVVRGHALLNRPHSAATRYEAIGCFELALAKDPDCADAKIGIAYALTANVTDGWSEPTEANMARAEALLLDVIRLDGNNPIARARMGVLRRIQGRLEDSRVELEIAVDLAPNDNTVLRQLGSTLVFLGQPGAAIPYIERSLRLAPHDPVTPIACADLARCHLLLGRPEEALIYLRRARAGNTRLFYIHTLFAAALGLTGRKVEAGVAWREAIESNPAITSLSGLRMHMGRQASPEFIRLWESTILIGLHQAGLPDE